MKLKDREKQVCIRDVEVKLGRHPSQEAYERRRETGLHGSNSAQYSAQELRERRKRMDHLTENWTLLLSAMLHQILHTT